MNDDVTTIRDLRELMAKFVKEREWEPFHDPKNLSASIAIEAAELMEHFQWLRNEQAHLVRNDAVQMVQIRDEVADVLAYLLSFVNQLGIDLSSALEEKMRKNAVKYPADAYRGRFK